MGEWERKKDDISDRKIIFCTVLRKSGTTLRTLMKSSETIYTRSFTVSEESSPVWSTPAAPAPPPPLTHLITLGLIKNSDPHTCDNHFQISHTYNAVTVRRHVMGSYQNTAVAWCCADGACAALGTLSVWHFWCLVLLRLTFTNSTYRCRLIEIGSKKAARPSQRLDLKRL